MTTPVSILMPCYNAERYLAAAVRSVLAQTHGDFELIAIDDGSTDRTLAILNEFAAADSRVRVISHENRGMGRALNDALEQCRHEWVARMDADDVMLPNRLERQLAFVAGRPEVVVASSLVQYIDESGAVIGRNRSEFTDSLKVVEAVAEHRLVGFHHPAVLMRRDVVKEAGGYRPQFWPCDDADLWNRIAERRPRGVVVQDEYLMQYRIHGSSVCVANARLTGQKTEWVAACVRERHANRPEPTWEQFQSEQKRLPWGARVNQNRRDYARTLYKAAVFHFSKRRYARFVPELAAALCLEPSYVFWRIVPQLGRWME